MVPRQPLVLAGAGGFAREVLEVVRAVNGVSPTWDLLGLADDDPSLWATTIAGVPVLGGVEEAASRFPHARVVLCTGNPRDYFSKRRVAHRLGLDDDRYATLVHPAAVLPPSVVVGAGSVVMAGVVGTADVVVGEHVAVMPAVVLTHDARVGDFSIVASRAALAGGVVVEEEAYIGAGALLGEGVRVGARSMVGMGAVVRHHVPRSEVWVGNPAFKLRDVLYSPPGGRPLV